MIAFVTYIRNQETLTPELIHLTQTLQAGFGGVECLIFSDEEIDLPHIENGTFRNVVMVGTKYRRLNRALREVNSEWILSVDNDIQAAEPVLMEFLQTAMESESDIAWGRIGTTSSRGLVESLVTVDKLLSHNILRPLLWRLRLGITVPGQVMLLRRRAFCGMQPEVDTYLDDLALGLYTHRHFKELRVFRAPVVLGFEKPNQTLLGLWRQRCRWTAGLRSLWKVAETAKDRCLIGFHYFVYHGLWSVNYLLIGLGIALAFYNSCFLLIPALCLGLEALIITWGRPSLIGWALVYLLFFPIFHIGGIVRLLFHLGGGSR